MIAVYMSLFVSCEIFMFSVQITFRILQKIFGVPYKTCGNHLEFSGGVNCSKSFAADRFPAGYYKSSPDTGP